MAILNPSQSNADGLIDCFGGGIDPRCKDSVLKVEDMPVLVRGGTDGVSVNVGVHNGMKAQLQATLPWLFWTWCFSQRLELACQDAFQSSLFTKINEMLLRLYSLYSKSPKKSQELAAIGENLKEVFIIPKGGNAPAQCQRMHWISHKRKALQPVVDRFRV